MWQNLILHIGNPMLYPTELHALNSFKILSQRKMLNMRQGTEQG